MFQKRFQLTVSIRLHGLRVRHAFSPKRFQLCTGSCGRVRLQASVRQEFVHILVAPRSKGLGRHPDRYQVTFSKCAQPKECVQVSIKLRPSARFQASGGQGEARN